MSKRVRFLLALLTISLAQVGFVQAQDTLPSYVASPSARAQDGTLCQNLTVVRSGRFVPSGTEFSLATAGDVKSYRMVYGDGVVRDFDTKAQAASHTYRQPGTYQAQLFVKNSEDEWETSEACKAEVKVESTPLVGQATSCEGLDVNDSPGGQGSTVQVEREVKFTVIGQDNKEKVGSYRVDFGDGEVAEQEDNVFFHEYDQNGTYTVQAAVRAKNAEEYVNDTGLCTRKVQVGQVMATPTSQPTPTATVSGGLKGLEKQPDTGPGTWLMISSVVLLGTGVSIQLLFRHTHG